MRIAVRGGGGPSPTPLPPPGDRRGTAIVDPGLHHPPELPVYLAREALRTMLAHAAEGRSLEVGGLLVGGLHEHEGGPYLDVCAAVPALKAKSERAQLTFDHEAQREAHALVEAHHPGRLVLGWYHTHPRYGVFLSEHDLFVQRSFFAAAHHVALVIDPYQEQRLDRVGVFVWEGGEVSQGYHPIVYETRA